jgi:large subunit ribosomal protein L13
MEEATTQQDTSMTHEIDAAGKRLGRVATEAASVLLGKNRTDFAKNAIVPVNVVITNASKMDVSDRRAREEFDTYSGYPSGRRVETLGHLAARRGYGEVLRRVVSGMLPKNKLRAQRLRNLEVSE